MLPIPNALSLETSLMSASHDVHFVQKNDMLLKYSIVKSTSEPKHKEKHVIFN